MSKPHSKPALLVLDFINEIVHPDGKYARHGYAEEAQRGGVLHNTARAIEHARAAGIPVIFVVVGFSPDYAEWPAGSPVFAEAKEDRRIILGSWGTALHELVAPLANEPVVVKHRISPFYQTRLELLLKQWGIDTLLLTGVSTEFVILSTSLEAHDRDYRVIVLEDAVSSSCEQHHQAALHLIGRVAEICKVDEALPARASVAAEVV